MRELKFRCWHINTMEYDVSVIEGKPYTSKSGYFELYSDREIENGILMQYTGLKDKNGKEIYEGDILEFTDKWEWYRGEWAPKFIFASEKQKQELRKEYDLLPTHKIVVDMSPEEGVNFSTYDLGEYRWQVIGNIHENPELIKQKS
jgi:uncharacterized phage protein (TIGR01671 family)